MKTLTNATLVFVLAFLLVAACGRTSGEDSSVSAPADIASRVAPVAAPTMAPLGSAPPPPAGIGDRSIEEKTIQHNTIVTAWPAATSTVTSDVVLGSDVYHKGENNRYRVIMKFSFTGAEYLKGSGPSDIVLVSIAGMSFPTREAADSYRKWWSANRDTQWDDSDRMALLFINTYNSGKLGTVLNNMLLQDNHFIFWGPHRFYGDDMHSLHSKYNRVWLPEVSPRVAVGEDRQFQVSSPEEPEASLSLQEVKKAIADITAELAAGDGSDEFIECIDFKYLTLRSRQNAAPGRGYTSWSLVETIASGQPENTLVDDRDYYNEYPSPAPTWIEGDDSHLFAVTHVEDHPNAGVDKLRGREQVVTERPLPAGEYTFTTKEQWPVYYYLACDFTESHDWTVTASAPEGEGVAHEFFFDPVVDGDTIASDADNGVLKPADFTDADGNSASISRLEWATSTVTLTVSPTSVMNDLALDFIETDGSVSLTLDYSDATVDTASSTLAWAVDSQPWSDGARLMVRIR